MIFIIRLRCHRFILTMPMAARVPITVAMIEEITAIISVLISELIMTSLVNSLRYQFNVKPVHAPRDLDWLNEKTIKTAIGA